MMKRCQKQRGSECWFAASLLMAFVVGAVAPSAASAVPRTPLNASDALNLFEASTVAGDVLQAQRALHWIRQNYVQTLQASPQVETLLPECLLQILSQPVLVAEIEVFRAVRRIVESYATRRSVTNNSSSANQHQVPRSVLLSTVRLLAIDIDHFRQEVIPSGIVPHNTVVQILLKIASKRSPPLEYTRPGGSFAFVNAPLVNVIDRLRYGTQLVAGTPFTLAPACHATNPLVEGSNNQPPCWIDITTGHYVTVDLRNRFLVKEIVISSPPCSERQCFNVRVETAGANRAAFELGATIGALCNRNVVTLTSAREVQFIRLRADGGCRLPGQRNAAVGAMRLTALAAHYRA